MSIRELLKPVVSSQEDMKQQIVALRSDIRRLRESQEDNNGLHIRDWFLISILLLVHIVLQYWLIGKNKQ